MSKIEANLGKFKEYERLKHELTALQLLHLKVRDSGAVPFDVKDSLSKELYRLMGKDAVLTLLETETSRMNAELADMSTIDDE